MCKSIAWEECEKEWTGGVMEGREYPLIESFEIVERLQLSPDAFDVGVGIRNAMVLHELGDADYSEVLVHACFFPQTLEPH